MERGEAFAGAAGKRDDLLAFVELECLPVGGGGFVVSTGSFEYLGEVGERVGLMTGGVGLLAVRDGFAGEVSKYKLWVTANEHDAMASTFAAWPTCKHP